MRRRPAQAFLRQLNLAVAEAVKADDQAGREPPPRARPAPDALEHAAQAMGLPALFTAHLAADVAAVAAANPDWTHDRSRFPAPARLVDSGAVVGEVFAW